MLSNFTKCTLHRYVFQELSATILQSVESLFLQMYWVDGDNVLTDNTCFSPGAPEYRWSREAGLNHIPH